jgi:branched-chain amino acid transport system substrate-binding protein
MGKRVYIAAALIGALAVAAVASAAGNGTPGVSSKEIVIGGTIPLTGPASAYASVARGAAAYFKYVNAHGGVNKRKIKYIYRNDEYDPVKTLDRTRELVQQDHVFAIFNTLGTETNLSIRGYLNQLKVPHLFVASGASTWGRDYKKYPWTIGYQPSYVAEATIYGRYIAKTAPNSRIGVLYQDDDYGEDLLKGLERGLGKKKSLVVSQQAYAVTDDNVKSQIARLKAKRANTLMIFATPKFAIQSYSNARQIGWRPKVYVNAVSSAANIMKIATLSSSKMQTEGSVSVVFLKDPTDQRWRRDKAVALFRSILKKYNGGKGLRDGRCPQARGQEPDARNRHEGGDAPERAEQSVRLARHLGEDDADEPVPARSGEARAVPQRALGLLRLPRQRQVERKLPRCRVWRRPNVWSSSRSRGRRSPLRRGGFAHSDTAASSPTRRRCSSR